MLDCLQMESAFSETRRAAGLLQQFSGFPFCRNDVCFFPLSLFSATHRTRSCPAALFDLHGVFAALVRSTALPRRPGITSPACIISGDGYSVVEVLFRICDRLFH